MATFAFELFAIFMFWKFADFTHFKKYLPVLLTVMLFRFIEHYLIIDWFKIFKIHGSKNEMLWIPISANVTIWPIVFYLFLQYMPKKKKWLYGLAFVLIVVTYLQCLVWLGVFSMEKGWNTGYTVLLQCLNFFVIYRLYKWLSSG